MGKSVKKNYIYNLIYQVLTLLLPLVTTPYLSRILQADGIGMVSYAESIVSYFALFAALGIATYGQREISYVQNMKEERSRVFWETQLAKLITSMAVFAVYVPFVLLAVEKDLVWLYGLLALQFFSIALNATWFFQGMEEFGKIISRDIVIKLLLLVSMFVFIKEKDDVVLYVLIYSLSGFVSAVSLLGYLPKYVKKIPFKSLRPFRNIKTIIALFVPTIAIQIYTVLDKTMIGIITDNAYQNGYYEQAMKITKMVLTVVTALGTVMIPRIGYHYEKGETEMVRDWMYRSYRFVWLLAIPMCIGLSFVAGNFVPWFFGGGYEGVIPLLQILSLLLLAIGVNNATGMQYLIPTKRENTFTLTVVIGAVVNFVLNLFLIYFFQAIGAAIASVVAETVIAIVQLIIVKKELSIVIILKSSVKYVVAGVVMGVVLFFESIWFSPSILYTLLMVASGAAVYFLSLLLLRDTFVISNLKTIFGKFIKKHSKGGEESHEI